MAEKILKPKSAKLDALGGELWLLFQLSSSSRVSSGTLNDVRSAATREILANNVPVLELGDDWQFQKMNESKDCKCTCDANESCDLCQKPLDSVCIENYLKECGSRSPFSGMANLITTVKKYEHRAVVETAYAEIGNKPFKLEATKSTDLDETSKIESATAFYASLENFLDENKIRIHELPDALDLETMIDVTDKLAESVDQDTEIRVRNALDKNEEVIERVFKRAEFMSEYMQAIIDTEDWPIGILWVDDKSIKREKIIRDGKLKVNFSDIQADATRIDPRYFWATEDHKMNRFGRAVFILKRLSRGDIARIKDHNVSGSDIINKNITEYLAEHENGYRMPQASLFEDDMLLDDGQYDVLVSRGFYTRENLEKEGIKINAAEFANETHIPCEVWYSGGKVLTVKVIECADEYLGVYTTTFRRRGNGIFGYSVHDFVHALAKMYEGALDALDKSVGKAAGSFISIDTGVVPDIEKYIRKDPVTNESFLDFSGDTIIEFDSTNAFQSNNFKGVPIHVTTLPTDIPNVTAVLNIIDEQMENLTGIPALFRSSQNVPSALRTTANYNAAYDRLNEGVKTILRDPENRMLLPGVKYFFETRAAQGEMEPYLVDAEPEILLSDKLSREENERRNLIIDIRELMATFGNIIPPASMAALVNNLGREAYNLRDDLIPGADVLSTVDPVQISQPA